MTPAWVLALHGDLKSFFVVTFPFQWIGPPPDPMATAIADGRLKLEVGRGAWRFDAHEELSVLPTFTDVSLGGEATGVALTAPELVDLTWEPDVGDRLVVRARTDRLSLSVEVPHLTVTVGRQPVSFGAGVVFTPMDVVNPFTGATIDTEYKPGVDAVRVDTFAGTSTRATVVAAWAGPLAIHDPEADPGLDDVILAVTGGGTIGTTDLFGLVASSRAEPVVGAGFTGSAGPVGVHGEATLTVPAADAAEEDPFVRAVVGADARLSGTTSLSGELYVQTFGASDPTGYLDVILGPRFARGEVWQAGRLYAAVAGAQEITPLVGTSLAVIVNLEDPSAIVAPGLSWSVADNAVVAAGMYAGVGARPEHVSATEAVATPDVIGETVRSEFGLYSVSAYVQMRAYF